MEDLLRECSSRNFAKDANAGVDDATVKVELDSSGNGDPVGADPDSEALCVDANKLLSKLRSGNQCRY